MSKLTQRDKRVKNLDAIQLLCQDKKFNIFDYDNFLKKICKSNFLNLTEIFINTTFETGSPQRRQISIEKQIKFLKNQIQEREFIYNCVTITKLVSPEEATLREAEIEIYKAILLTVEKFLKKPVKTPIKKNRAERV